MLGIGKGKNEDQDRIRESMLEIKELMEKHKNIGADINLDMEKYSQMVAEIETMLSGGVATNEVGQTFDVMEERKKLMKKTSTFGHLSQKMQGMEKEYVGNINEIKHRLQQPEAELSRIKVVTKGQKREIENISLKEDVQNIPQILSEAEQLLQTMIDSPKKPENREETSANSKNKIQLIRDQMGADEKKLYALRKEVHNTKEILAFMEFRFADMDKKVAKTGQSSLGEEWGQLRREREMCERYVNEQFLIAKRGVDTLYEVRGRLDLLEKQTDAPVEDDTTSINELRESIDVMRNHATDIQMEVAAFEQKREMWLSELSQIEMTLEEMWRNL